MTNKFNVAKGVKDWYGPEAILRNRIRDTLRDIFENYGYNPLETPIIEQLDTLTYKGGGEIQKEIFRLTDQGGRNLGLRFDQTVPLARFYATHDDIALPFKRYAIGEVFRDGPTQVEQGRYRIFTQCDIDILGIQEMTAEVELFSLARDAFKKLGLGDVEVKLNNKKVLDKILDYANIPQSLKTKTIITLDKLDKIGSDAVKEELLKIGANSDTKISKDNLDKLFDIISQNETNKSTYDKILKNIGDFEGLREVKTLLEYSEKLGLDFISFDPSLARGLDYYTGTTIEVYLKNKDVLKSAIVAGGRYDNMIGDYKGVQNKISAVGISFGLERLVSVINSKESHDKKSVTDIYMIPIGNNVEQCLKISQWLRNTGLNVDMQYSADKKIGKSIAYAQSQGIRYIGIVGDEETANDTLTIKDLETRQQETLESYKAGLKLHAYTKKNSV